jgi:hypothetical protein
MTDKFAISGYVAAVALTLTGGLVEGRLTNRWGPPAHLTAAAERLAQVPEQIGDWHLESSKPFDKSVEQMLECAGHFLRVYTNDKTGESVSVAMLVGPPGPTAVHTPEICYSSRNHHPLEEKHVVQIRPAQVPDESFWGMTFQSTGIEPHRLRVLYAWSGADGHWRAAKNPRMEHAGDKLLFKIQLAANLPRESANDSASDPCQRFLADFLPALDAGLFSHPKQEAAVREHNLDKESAT